MATPPYLSTLTTEVLGKSTKTASYQDLCHARDEGVLKQGFLITPAAFGWARKRRWYRLHDGSLYYLAVSAAYDPVFVLSLKEASVSLSSGKAPFTFVVEDAEGTRLELQAENEDDMVKWITAIRRCRRRFRRRPTSEHSPPRHPLMEKLRAANVTCCECESGEVAWAAYNIGCILCEQCASVHRQMGIGISKLRSLELDDWPESLLQCFVRSLGNRLVNSVWEAAVMKGWTRPVQESDIEKKAQWIVSKYQWYAFVDEDRGAKEVNSKRLCEAAGAGDVGRAMWCIAHKGSPSWADPEQENRTALHASTIGGHLDCTLFLLLNGGHAVIRVPDRNGQTCYDIARRLGDKSILQLFLEWERGDFL